MSRYRRLLSGGVAMLVLPVAAMAQSQADAPAPTRVVLPAAKMAAQCITQVSPNYPRGVQQHPAAVVIQTAIHRNGSVTPLHIVSGDSSLAFEAMNALRLWHYRPYMVNGQPTEVLTEVQVDFVPGKLGGLITHPIH